jgi:hypothetical protein
VWREMCIPEGTVGEVERTGWSGGFEKPIHGNGANLIGSDSRSLMEIQRW